MSVNAKYATLCLLITYHWHASWAVSAWSSVGSSIAAEVNGSPTDAWLNIPVVKRSSNQAELANEPPLRRYLIRGDSLPGLVEYRDLGLSVSTNREYSRNASSKYTEPMIRRTKSTIAMIVASPIREMTDESDGSPNGVRMKKTLNEENKRKQLEIKETPGSQGGRTLMPRLIPATNSSKLISQNMPGREDAVGAFASISARMGKLENKEKVEVDLANNGTTIERAKIDGGRVFDGRRTRRRGTGVAMSSRRKRKAMLPDAERIKETNEKTTKDHGVTSRGSLLLSNSHESKERLKSREEGGKVTLDVAKLLDSSRLHQQSRNTRPRTIVQHLRGAVIRQTRDYENSSRSSKNCENELGNRPIGSRVYGRSGENRSRRQSRLQRMPNFARFTAGPNQLRFIPYYNYDKYAKSSTTQGGSFYNMGVIDDKRSKNIADLSSLDEEHEIENDLRKSLGSVFDRQIGAERTHEFSNVRAILPKQVFLAPTRLIYDTKILPAPFDLDKFFRRPGDIVVHENHDGAESPSLFKGMFQPDEMKVSFEKSAAIPVADDPEESITSSQMPGVSSPPGQGSVVMTQLGLPPSFVNRPNTMHHLNSFESTEKTSTPSPYETFQRDADKPQANQSSASDMTGEDHSDKISPSPDNSGSAYAGEHETDPDNDDTSSIVGPINDEYANHGSSRYHDAANVESGAGIRMTQMRGREIDHRYNEGSNKWRGRDDNDHARYVAKYSFGYLVEDDDSHNDFGHQEMRNEGITRGRYHVRLPDGRIQKVKYRVDDNGYHAEVSYRRDDTL